MQDEVLDTKQVADILKTTPRVVAEMLASGELVGIKVGRSWTMARSRLLEYIRNEKLKGGKDG